jgi:hypothetical protein
MSDRRMNRIVFVLYNLFISFAVDLIQLFLYFSFVMSSWCLRDFPVSGCGVRREREAMISLGQRFSHHVLRQVLLPSTTSHHTM